MNALRALADAVNGKKTQTGLVIMAGLTLLDLVGVKIPPEKQQQLATLGAAVAAIGAGHKVVKKRRGAK